MLSQILLDALFAAIAAVGFAAISRPPKWAYLICAILAAVGHSLRFVLMSDSGLHIHIVVASTIAAFIVGVLAVFSSPLVRMPAETCLFPALLPMIPGVYAYRAFGALVMCILGSGEQQFQHYFYLFTFNGFTCLCIIIGMVIGATMPIFLFKKISFKATR